MQQPNPFKWRHYQAEIILLCLRWYLRYSLSYRDLEELMAERGLKVDHSTIARWVLAYAPELEKRVKPQLKPSNDSWRVDETYIKVKGEWLYQYRAVDSAGQTVEFWFSAKRDAAAAHAAAAMRTSQISCASYARPPCSAENVLAAVLA